jgi:hypothetical protein
VSGSIPDVSSFAHLEHASRILIFDLAAYLLCLDVESKALRWCSGFAVEITK